LGITNIESIWDKEQKTCYSHNRPSGIKIPKLSRKGNWNFSISGPFVALVFPQLQVGLPNPEMPTFLQEPFLP
jgi:hypothetical protein